LADHIILYLNDPKASTRRLLGTINNFMKVWGYIATYKSVVFLYTSSEHANKEAKQRIPYIIPVTKVKYVPRKKSNQSGDRIQ
jgi:hypothetical protein